MHKHETLIILLQFLVEIGFYKEFTKDKSPYFGILLEN